MPQTHGRKAEARARHLSRIVVRARPGAPTRGWLIAGPLRLPVALGRTGLKADKHEGDGGTPRGRFRPVRLWWRADRGPFPRSGLPTTRITRDLAWCEDPTDRRYNKPFRRLKRADGTAEPGDVLWRDDRLYDLVIEIDHNRRPRVAGRGSAVFIHVARAGFSPTAGCVALTPGDLRRLLEKIGPRTRIVVG
ncbi:L,D-transpeptidase family protein [Rhodoplanes elegans]|uniref:L,D-transpeptidase family protein n=1 Tax=Rhodoplanes elegans TaxID=29408 RepID=UPI003B830D3E